MNIEDMTITKKKKKGERLDNGYIHHQSKVRRYSNYTPLSTLLDQVLMQTKDNPSLEWPKKLKGDPSKQNKGKYYHFHHDHGHDTDECDDLK